MSVLISPVFAGGVEQYSQSWSESPGEVRRQRVERGVTGMQGSGQSALGREEAGEPQEPALERLAGRMGGAQHRSRIGASIHLALKDRPHQVRALREVPLLEWPECPAA